MAGTPKAAANKGAAAKRPRVVFFGSGPVAAACLELLLAWCEVEAVITKPQPPHHRQTFPVIAAAARHGLYALFATNRRELDNLIAEAGFTSQAAILIDYGIIVSRMVIDNFPLGIVNSHFSLLPEWRGADPISFAILSGQNQTGVSLMLLVEAMDEGPLLAQAAYAIKPDETTPSLTSELVVLSDSLLASVLPAYLSGTPAAATGQPVAARSQQAAMAAAGQPYQPTYSRKLSKDDGQLDFSKPAVQLEREVRAFLEWPKSRTNLAGKDVVITAAHAAASHEIPSPNTLNTLTMPTAAGIGFVTPDKRIGITTVDGVLIIDRLKPAGKADMPVQAFLAGHPLVA